MSIPSESLAEPLAATIGVLWHEVVKAGTTLEALQRFEDRLRTLRMLVGNCDAPQVGVVICNHIGAVKQMINRLAPSEQEVQAQIAKRIAYLHSKYGPGRYGARGMRL